MINWVAIAHKIRRVGIDQQELGKRIELEAHGPEVSKEEKAELLSKASYHLAMGYHLIVAAVTVATFDPNDEI